jgi:hypothetical protein
MRAMSKIQRYETYLSDEDITRRARAGAAADLLGPSGTSVLIRMNLWR